MQNTELASLKSAGLECQGRQCSFEPSLANLHLDCDLVQVYLVEGCKGGRSGCGGAKIESSLILWLSCTVQSHPSIIPHAASFQPFSHSNFRGFGAKKVIRGLFRREELTGLNPFRSLSPSGFPWPCYPLFLTPPLVLRLRTCSFLTRSSSSTHLLHSLVLSFLRPFVTFSIHYRRAFFITALSKRFLPFNLDHSIPLIPSIRADKSSLSRVSHYEKSLDEHKISSSQIDIIILVISIDNSLTSKS